MEDIKDFLEDVTGRDPEDAFGLLQTLMESLPYAAFFVATPDRGIAWCNAAAPSVFGFERSELIGESTLKLHVDETQFESFDAASGPVIGSGRPFRGHFWMRRRNGEIFPSAHLVTPVRTLREQTVVISFVEDLSGATSAVGDKFDRLTDRERTILQATMQGSSAKEIARQFTISPRTVEAHRASIIEKFEVDSIHQLLSCLLNSSRQLGLTSGSPLH